MKDKKTAGKITVTLKGSSIGCSEAHRACIRGLGLRKWGSSRTLENTSAVRGMIKKIIHLLEVEEGGKTHVNS